MVCFIPGSAFTAAAFSIFGYLCWGLIVRVFDIVWAIGVIAGKAAAATMVLIVLTVAVAFVKWTADVIRRRQQATGACNTCPHPCKGVHVAATPVALPEPRVRDGETMAG